MKYIPLLITVNLSVLMICLVCTKSHHHHHHDHHEQHHGKIHKSRRVHPGHRMNPDQTKFMAVLYRTHAAGRWLVCSATFIEKLHLITAAHCVSKESEWSQMTVLPASVPFDSESIKHAGHRAKRTIANVSLHPRYSPDSEPYFDVAIIRLDKHYRKVQQLPLPLEANPGGVYQAPFKAYGHVETANTKPRPNARFHKEAHVNEMQVDHFLPQAECVNHLHILWIIYDQYDMFCVANPTGTRPDPIDAGGPLIGHKANTGAPVLLGIRSTGNAHVYYYVNVTTMMPWISQTIRTSYLQSRSRSPSPSQSKSRSERQSQIQMKRWSQSRNRS